jgi:putative membrane protein
MHWFWWIFWGVVILSVIWMVVRTQRRAGPSARSSRETLLDTLQRRYAEGEISTEEYEERKERLERDR